MTAYLAACATALNENATKIRWVSSGTDVAGCEFLGLVEGASVQSGTANIATGRNNARNEALNKAAAKGATHVHWLTNDESWSGLHYSAEAFDCDRSARVADDDEPPRKRAKPKVVADDDDETEGRSTRVVDEQKTEPRRVSTTKAAPASPNAGTRTPESGFTSSGSCFFVSPDGIVVTNRHVVAGAKTITVVDAAGDRLPATVLRSLPDVDLVALDVPGVAKHAALRFDPSADVQLGQVIFTIGFPYSDYLGSDPKFADGSVSGLKGVGDGRLLQMTIPVQPGNSGGPVATDAGVVVGVVVSRLNELQILKDTGTLPANVGFAIKASQLPALLRGVTLSSAKRTTNRADAVANVQAASCQVVATVPGDDSAAGQREEQPSAREGSVDSADELWKRGAAAFESGRYDDAIQTFKVLAESHPNRARAADAEYFRGMSHFNLRQWQMAIASYQVVAEKHADSALADDALYYAAVASLKFGACAEANAYLKLLARDYPRSNVSTVAANLNAQIARERGDRSRCSK